MCGPDLTYTDRAQIVSNAASKIMIDLGRDAAVDTKWTISCGPDRLGQISNGVTRPMTATLILPSPATVDRCSDLLTDQPPAPNEPAAADEDPLDELFEADEFDETDTDPQLPVLAPTAAALPDTAPPVAGGIDFFAPSPASTPGMTRCHSVRIPATAPTLRGRHRRHQHTDSRQRHTCR